MIEIPQDLLAGWQIVVVDDEEDSLEVARYILDYHGATVHVGTNGEEGLSVIRRVAPRFIISDLSMPRMDGWEMLHHLKLDPQTREIPVIALTAHAMQGDRERAISAGFHNYLTKPLTATTFIRQLLVLLTDIPTLSIHLKL